MKIQLLNKKFNVYKLSSFEDLDWRRENSFLSVTEDEISFVCDADYTPNHIIAAEKGWSAFKIIGTLDFSLVGILAKISGILADNKISIFAISTFNTDYILLKEDMTNAAIEALEDNGYEIISNI